MHAIRLRTLPLALASILMASFVAYHHDTFQWSVFILAALTTTFLQVLSNLANDYGDSIHGADSNDRKGPIRAVQSGIIAPAEMKIAMYLLGFLSFCSGMALLYIQQLVGFCFIFGFGRIGDYCRYHLYFRHQSLWLFGAGGHIGFYLFWAFGGIGHLLFTQYAIFLHPLATCCFIGIVQYCGS